MMPEENILKIKSLAITLLSVLILLGCASTGANQSNLGADYARDVNWHRLAEGSKIALAEKKPMVVDFGIPEKCERCEFLENNVYNRKKITDKLNTDFVPIWIDLLKELTPEEKALGEKFDYQNECLLLFLDYEGNIIKDPEGKKMCFVDKIPPKVFIDYLDYVLEKYTVVQ